MREGAIDAASTSGAAKRRRELRGRCTMAVSTAASPLVSKRGGEPARQQR